jgi:MFS family permease
LDPSDAAPVVQDRSMRLHRTPITWAIYGVNGAWAAFVYLSGPVSPILSEDLGMSLAVAGLVGTALALGISTASVTAPRAVRRLGRDLATKVGLAVLAAALVGMVLVPLVASGSLAFGLILGLVWVCATGGGTTLNASMARLSDAHPEHSAQVITEANAAAAWVGLFSPLILGAALGAGFGWQVGIGACLIAALAALVGLAVADRVTARSGQDPAGGLDAVAGSSHELGVEPALEPVPGPEVEPVPPTTASTGGRLPRAFWNAMVGLFAAVATEFAINYWGSTLIQEQTGASTSSATAAMAAVVTGLAIGRTVGSGFTLRLGPHRMLLGGFSLALVGFGVLWTAGTVPQSVVGLFVAGLGLATLFPLLLDRGIVLSAGHPDLALARSSLVLGIAVATAPFALGALGSVMAVRTALLLVPVIVVVGLLGVVTSRPATPERVAVGG